MDKIQNDTFNKFVYFKIFFKHGSFSREKRN